jgi:hypothetical protein
VVKLPEVVNLPEVLNLPEVVKLPKVGKGHLFKHLSHKIHEFFYYMESKRQR